MRAHRYISSAVAKGRPNSVSHTRTRGAGLATYYEYDAANELLTENLMTRIDFPDNTHSYYTYDADSKRVSQRTADGYSEFIYQGPDMLKLQMERDEAGDTKVQYTMGIPLRQGYGGQAGLEAMRRDAGSGMASGDSSFYHYNHLGTTVALTNAAESVRDTYRHDAWGVRLASTGSTVNPHTYVGRERYYRMPNAGLYHLGFRDYAQRVGRFTTVDPAGTPSGALPISAEIPASISQQGIAAAPLWLIGGVRLPDYPYVINHAVRSVDARGLFPWGYVCIILVVGGIVTHICWPREEEDQGLGGLIQMFFTNIVEQVDECTECADYAPLIDPLLNAIGAVERREEVAETCKGSINEICIAMGPYGADSDIEIWTACHDCCLAIASAAGIDAGFVACHAACQNVADRAMNRLG